jgi:hypothetical protein
MCFSHSGPARVTGVARTRALTRIAATLDACEDVIASLAERGAADEAARLGMRVAFARRELEHLRASSPDVLTSPAQDRLWEELSSAAEA